MKYINFEALNSIPATCGNSLLLFYIDSDSVINDKLNEIERITGSLFRNYAREILSEPGKEISLTSSVNSPSIIHILRIPEKTALSPDYFRNHIAGLTQSLTEKNISSLTVVLPEYSNFKSIFMNEEYFLQTFVEGIGYGVYNFSKYKTAQKNSPLKLVNLVYKNIDSLKSAINFATLLMSGVYFARELANEPANVINPVTFCERVRDALNETGCEIIEYNENNLKEMNAGGILAVGLGSDTPPRLLKVVYNPESRDYKSISFVGKGVTFDSGGISIKPATNMGWMKADMSGAAVVAGIMLAVSKLKLPVKVTGFMPLAENMLSGRAMRPGDIITTASGKTVEIDNTDAEGRLILADALYFASQEKPAYLIDLATLTGSVAVALGDFVAGLMTKDDKLAKLIYSSGAKTFERFWQLPLWDDYAPQLKSDVADLKNIGGKWGGAITAGKFLENFVDPELKWAHLDIAGPSMANTINNYSKPFMNGFGVRTMVNFLNDLG